MIPRYLLGISVPFLLFHSSNFAHPYRYVDLGITSSEVTNRPAILIAWRNTHKIFEAEVQIRNFGEREGSGKVYMEILDEKGDVLMRRPEPGQEVKVTIPPASQGGKEGKIVQILGSKDANRLLDQLDREKAKYAIRATVLPLQGDVNDANNVSVRTYNTVTLAHASGTFFYPYYFKNTSSKMLSGKLSITATNIPKDWKIIPETKEISGVELKPGQMFQGHIMVETGTKVTEGQFLDLQFTLTDTKTQNVFDKREWYLVADNHPPEIRETDIDVNNKKGEINLQLVAHDKISGIAEASGVKIEYSTDGGITFSNKVATYIDGNFIKPTRFQALLGPFSPGASIDIWASVNDSAGNITRRKLKRVQFSRPQVTLSSP